MSENAFLRDSSPRRAKLALGAAAGLALAALVGYLAGSGATHPAASAPSTARTSAPAAAATPSAVPTASASSLGLIQLVRGSTLINGMYVGYPHSTTGAISAAVEYVTQIGSTLDPDRAATVARLAADPSYTGAQTDAAQGAVSDRTSLGLPSTGSLPAGSSITVEPVEYQLRDVQPDRALVLLLADMSTSTTTGGSQTRLAVFPLVMHYTAGDWKFLPFDNSANWAALSAVPGSADAAGKGWAEFTAS
jgi:hypothetical protein